MDGSRFDGQSPCRREEQVPTAAGGIGKRTLAVTDEGQYVGGQALAGEESARGAQPLQRHSGPQRASRCAVEVVARISLLCQPVTESGGSAGFKLCDIGLEVLHGCSFGLRGGSPRALRGWVKAASTSMVLPLG